MTSPPIAIVIPVFNGERYLPALLDSIRSQSVSSQVILVDNGSTDQAVAKAMTSDKSLFGLDLPRNEGFGVACNAGIQAALLAGAEWVFVLNQDLILEPNALAQAITAAQSQPRIGFLALSQLTYDGTGLDPVFRVYLPAAYWDDVLFRQPQPTYEVPFIPAAAVLLRRDCLLEQGAFDPLYFMYLEDRDLCERLRTRGWKVAFAPAARVRHDCGQVRAARGFQWNLNWYRSRMLYHLKTSRRPLPVAYLTGLGHLLPRWSPTEAFHWGVAWCRALFSARQLARHRRSVVEYLSTGESKPGASP